MLLSTRLFLLTPGKENSADWWVWEKGLGVLWAVASFFPSLSPLVCRRDLLFAVCHVVSIPGSGITAVMTRYVSLFGIIPLTQPANNSSSSCTCLPILLSTSGIYCLTPFNPGWPFDLFIPMHCSGWDTLWVLDLERPRSFHLHPYWNLAMLYGSQAILLEREVVDRKHHVKQEEIWKRTKVP